MPKKTVLITGANRGIGLQFVRNFLALDWNVIACCRNVQKAQALNDLSDEHANLEVHTLDVTDYQRMAELAEEIKHRHIDVLLSNAGVYGPRNSFGQIEAAAWRDVLEANTIAPLMLVQHFVEHVAASDNKVVALVSSKMGSIADNNSGGSYIYRSSKTALNQVAKSLSLDLAHRDISVITLHPGWVKTDMGGPNALTSIEDSVAGMMNTLQSAVTRSGEFIDLDGSVIPW